MKTLFMSCLFALSASSLGMADSSLKLELLAPKEPVTLSKADLVKVAQEELGMTLAAAEAKTVMYLREVIRKKRKETMMEQDPLMVVPSNLDRLLRARLRQIGILVRSRKTARRNTKKSIYWGKRTRALLGAW